MKKLCYIALLLLWKPSNAQDSCGTRYSLPVQHLQLAHGDLAWIESGKGKALLLVHGLGGNATHWNALLPELSANAHCYAIDLPGYGASGPRDTTSKDLLLDYAETLAAFIKQKKLGRVAIAGHSMGGQIAVILALTHPELVERLLLLAPAGLETFTESDEAKLTAVTRPSVFENQGEAGIRASVALNFYRPSAVADELIADRIRKKNCAGFAAYTRTVSAGIQAMLKHPVRADLHSLNMPLLVLFGEHDGLIPNRWLHPGNDLHQLVKDATKEIKSVELQYIADAGHLLQVEQPGAVAETIKNFLTKRF
jgi:pimeloyl-ACP methyl ester carboxylesterase